MWKGMQAAAGLAARRVPWRKVFWAGSMAALLVGAFYFGRQWGSGGEARAADGEFDAATGVFSPTDPVPPGRPVAYLHGNIPVTRQELGEYLIARLGGERIEFLINRKLIELACAQKGIVVTDAEVEEQLVQDLKTMKINNLKSFVNVVLKQFGNKTLYEYKEDVIRPKLAMTKYCRDMIAVTEQDLRDAYEAKYGPQVECRMIILQADMPLPQKMKIWTEVFASAEAFDKYAREQFVVALASQGGKAPPIHKHFGDARVEKEAFSLKPGDVSQLLEMKDGTHLILKCVKHLPDSYGNHRLEDEQAQLGRQVREQKLAEAIPQTFQELKKQAAPRIFLTRETIDPSFEERVNRQIMPAGAVLAPGRQGEGLEVPLAPPGLQQGN